MALELVTFDDIKGLLELNKADITDYPALNVINGTMINSFEEFLGRQLNSESRTETIWAYSTKKRVIRLPAIPVASITSVTVTSGGEDESWVETNDYDITGYGIKLLTAIANSKLVVVYTGGLSAVAEEPGLNRAALYQLSYEYQNKDRIGAERVSNEGGSVEIPELGLLKETKRLLKSHRHPLHTGT